MTDELWEQVRRLRDEAMSDASVVDGLGAFCDGLETVCRLAGRPLPEWRPTSLEDGK